MGRFEALVGCVEMLQEPPGGRGLVGNLAQEPGLGSARIKGHRSPASSGGIGFRL